MITTVEEGTDEERLARNRANNLLKSLLHSRHSNVMADEDAELAVDVWLVATPLERLSMTKDFSALSIIDNHENLTEQTRDKLIWYLCSKYMIDFDSSHNTPLDPLLFTIPSSSL